MKLMKFVFIYLVLTLSFAGFCTQAWCMIDVYEFDDATQEARYYALIDELRCPKCQNQNLANSDAPIAQDLKKTTYELIKAGSSDDEIRQFMQVRYGDFINYKPPINSATYVLWFLPPFVLIIAILFWFWHIKIIRNRLTKPVDKNIKKGNL